MQERRGYGIFSSFSDDDAKDEVDIEQSDDEVEVTVNMSFGEMLALVKRKKMKITKYAIK